MLQLQNFFLNLLSLGYQEAPFIKGQILPAFLIKTPADEIFRYVNLDPVAFEG